MNSAPLAFIAAMPLASDCVQYLPTACESYSPELASITARSCAESLL